MLLRWSRSRNATVRLYHSYDASRTCTKSELAAAIKNAARCDNSGHPAIHSCTYTLQQYSSQLIPLPCTTIVLCSTAACQCCWCCFARSPSDMKAYICCAICKSMIWHILSMCQSLDANICRHRLCYLAWPSIPWRRGMACQGGGASWLQAAPLPPAARHWGGAWGPQGVTTMAAA